MRRTEKHEENKVPSRDIEIQGEAAQIFQLNLKKHYDLL